MHETPSDKAVAARTELDGNGDGWACRYHQTLSADGWIVLRCITCNRRLMAATHMDLWDWMHKARDHEARYHADNQDEDIPDLDPGCERCADV